MSVLWFLHRSNATAARFLTPRTTFTILIICSPACVALYFAAGRLTVQPNPIGIHQMNSSAAARKPCCSRENKSRRYSTTSKKGRPGFAMC
jgi:hypothetical protein